MFLWKLDSSGNLLWVKRAGGPDHEEGVGVFSDRSGNIFVAGIMAQTVEFAPGVTLTSAGEWDLFFAKYDPAGNLLFARRGGGPGFDEGYSAVVDPSGNIVVIGTFEATAEFAPGVELTSAGDSDAYLAKYDSAGNLVWIKQIGGPGFDQGREIALDSSGNIYVGGRWFGGPLTLTPDVVLSNAGGNDLFVAKYSASGDLIYGLRGGGPASDTILGIAVDDSGNSFVTGTISGRANLGGGLNLISEGSSDFLIARVSEFDMCLREPGSGYRFRLNSATGDYQITNCSTTFALSGTAETTRTGCVTMLKDRQPRHKLEVVLKSCLRFHTGKVKIRVSSLADSDITLFDGNIADSVCDCPGRL
jgi:hypothetical protein